MKIILLLFAFALIHSVTASARFKKRIIRWWGENSYRRYYTLLYNLISVLTIVPILWTARLSSSGVWHLSGFPGLAFLFVQLVGVAGVVFSLYQVDPLNFVGVRQLIQHYSLNSNQKSNELVVSGLYKIVRHPLYLFSMMVIWFVPIMTLNWLAFCIGSSLYFWIGSYFEERKMVREFGAAYLQYQKSIPRFFPFIKF